MLIIFIDHVMLVGLPLFNPILLASDLYEVSYSSFYCGVETILFEMLSSISLNFLMGRQADQVKN